MVGLWTGLIIIFFAVSNFGGSDGLTLEGDAIPSKKTHFPKWRSLLPSMEIQHR